MVDFVEKAVQRVCLNNLRASVRELSASKNRHACWPGIVDVQKYLFSRFAEYQKRGFACPQYQPFSLLGSCANPLQQNNVFFGPKLESLPDDHRGVVLICAHYDSDGETHCEEGPGNCDYLAPGANDNATGVAALFELARLCPTADSTQVNIVFAAFGGEEIYFSGSTEAARIAVTQSWPVKLVINMDMVGNNPRAYSNRVLIQYDNFPSARRDTVVSRACARLLAQMAEKYTDLSPWLASFRKDSDHVPFWRNDFAVIKLEEFYRENDRYHKKEDLPCAVDYKYLANITKMVLAFVLTLSERDG